MTETEWTALTITITAWLWAVAIAVCLPQLTGKLVAFFDDTFALIAKVLNGPVTWVMRLLRFNV